MYLYNGNCEYINHIYLRGGNESQQALLFLSSGSQSPTAVPSPIVSILCAGQAGRPGKQSKQRKQSKRSKRSERASKQARTLARTHAPREVSKAFTTFLGEISLP